jgi:hypothetical protein
MSLALIQPYTPTAEDMALESRLRVCMSQYNNARTPARKRVLWAKYRSLHNQRSPDYVRYLELAKGLYRG